MKKSIKITFSLIMSIILFTGNLSFAQEKALTYDEALKIAISSNDNLRKLKNERDLAWNQRNSLGDGIPEPVRTSPAYISGTIKATAQLEGTTQILEKQYEVSLEAVEFNLKKIFFNVYIHEENIKIKNSEIKNLQETLELQRIKKTYGTSSEFEVKKIENDLDKARKDKAVSEKEVEKQYFALNKLLGQKTVKYTKINSISLEYSPVEGNDAEQKIGLFLANSSGIDQAKLSIKLLELQKELYPVDSLAAAMQGNYNGVNKPEKISDQISIASDSLNIQTKNLEEQIRTMQNGLKTMELNVKTLETQMKNLDEHLRIAEAQLNAGMIVPKQVEDIKLQKEKLENAIYNLKSQHTLLRLQFEKPYLLGA